MRCEFCPVATRHNLDLIAFSGCQSPDIVRPDSIFQAASLTKPVIAYETCGWQEGRDSIFTRRRSEERRVGKEC